MLAGKGGGGGFTPENSGNKDTEGEVSAMPRGENDKQFGVVGVSNVRQGEAKAEAEAVGRG